jgi:hypothetical protein
MITWAKQNGILLFMVRLIKKNEEKINDDLKIEIPLNHTEMAPTILMEYLQKGINLFLNNCWEVE